MCARTPLALRLRLTHHGRRDCCSLTELLGNLPTVVLAAIVLVALEGLVDVRALRHSLED